MLTDYVSVQNGRCHEQQGSHELVDSLVHYGNETFFHSSKTNQHSIADYLERLLKYLLTESDAICLLIYMRRLAMQAPKLIDCYTVRKALAACAVAAVKMGSERLYNKSMANVLLIKPANLTNIENELLNLLDYELYISPELYHDTYLALTGDETVSFEELQAMN
jgi:hypothetical protein